MKPTVIAAVLAFGALGPAFAVAGTVPAKKPTPKAARLNGGASYIVGTRRDADEVSKTSRREQEFAGVMKAKAGEVQACWSLFPMPLHKLDTPAVLRLEIDDSGEVQDVEVIGKVPEAAQRCIALAAASWVFPATEVTADASYFEFPVTLHAR